MNQKDLDEIAWRAGRGSHFESAFLGGSLYAQQVIEKDVPALIGEVRRLQAKLEASEVLIKRYASEHALCAEEEPGEGCPCTVCEEAQKILSR